LVEKFYLQQYSEGIFIWSDKGFKNKMNIYYFLNLQQKLQTQIQCHFFAAYHGYSICDRHFGTAKRKLRSINRTTLVCSIEQVNVSFISISNTSTYLIDIDQESHPKVPRNFQFENQIRKFHEWQFTADKKVMCIENSQERETLLYNKFLILNLKMNKKRIFVVFVPPLKKFSHSRRIGPF
jgi:hypothetical protein